ncbi:putative late blight resistance protein homolog R1B-16 [Salvia splendens]|uniref:putative late blight resistance protein homolog R1B-16 n=1 Tax=Salvia splendens TaxID=180675 RepID=UPI001C27CB60|nr:putative late blight resistance protein homolog R1B-16 [Salvia splendens]
MAAYAALVSVMQTIHQIEHHPSPPISMDKKQVESLTEIVMFLQEFLESYKSPYADGDEADPLEMCIADAAYAAEDAIELRIVDQLVPAASASAGSSTSADLYETLVKVIENMYLIKKEVMEIKDQQTQVSAASSSSSSSTKSSSPFGVKSTAMVGFDHVKIQLMEKLVYGEHRREVIPITGMGGIGKTTLAKNVYAHPSVSHHFDICAWVTISQQYNTKELLREILSQANKQGSSQMSEEDEIGVALHKCLTYRRYLVVLDDMWSIEAWDVIQRYLPDNSNGSRIMVTTRLSNLGSQLDNSYGHGMRFLNEESSWNLFCKIVFGGKSCPLELEKIGKKIVKSCRGLPLSIVVMGGLLEKMEQTKECWKSIRRSMSSLVNLENDKHCLKILKLSYNHLPVYLKPCFLYLGMFEEDSKIRVSRVIELWVSEGFIKPIRGKSLETIAKEYMDELVDRNLILVHELGKTGNMKQCKIHDLLRDLCLKEAEKERFYDVIGQHSPQGTCTQRRVAIMGSTSKEKVVDAMKSRPYARTCISDRERVRLLPNLKLVRTLRLCGDGYITEYSLRRVFELVNLRLVAVHFDGDSSQVPSSMNLLWSLQTLIVSSSQKIVNAPVDIWNMSQLRHVKVRNEGWHLPAPPPPPPSDNIVIMENLQTLKGVINFKCDEMMLHRIPNIKKLGLYFDNGMRIECLDNLKHLQKLESLSCSWLPVCGLLRKVNFPHSLKSLSLRMPMGRMEDIMEKVSTLPLLQKLKLYRGVFTTRKWETVEGQFPSLKYLSLTETNLECWTMESSHFPCLEHLLLYYLKDLKEFPAEVGEIPTLKSVVLSTCSKSAVKSAKRMIEEQEELQGQEQLSFQLTAY